jgi:acetyl esterase/lipase
MVGGLSAVFYLVHIVKVTGKWETVTSIEQAFGPQWLLRIPPERIDFFLSRHYVFFLPKVRDPIFNPNIVFYALPGTGRELLCDIWQPPAGIKHSRLCFIYLHGSAWTHLDKDYGTRPFFKRLTQQGHVVMDVAYRLYPETDFVGMIHDASHAVAWMKANAAAYQVNPDCIVIGGGSAGAHIALLAAYTNPQKLFVPGDLQAADLKLRAVVSYYGQADLTATFYHTCQHLDKHPAVTKTKKAPPAGMPRWMQNKIMKKDLHRLGFDKAQEPGKLTAILEGSPEERPEAYDRFSPVQYVHPDCPPTLLIHGEHDILAPLQPMRLLHERLNTNSVPVVFHILPQTDHGFDLILPNLSPSAHYALYDVERFLALQVENSTGPLQRNLSPGINTQRAKKT